MRTLNAFFAWVLVASLAGCATTADIVVDQDPSANLGSYRTFGFIDDVATDGDASYSSLVTQHLKQATRVELERLGYVYDERAPDLRVNFFLNVAKRQEIRSMPISGAPVGFLGYGPWRGYGIETVQYKEGTLRIDLVDASRNSLVWQGVAEGKLRREALENPGRAVGAIVAEIFGRFPGGVRA
jgi:hypothetical protein